MFWLFNKKKVLKASIEDLSAYLLDIIISIYKTHPELYKKELNYYMLTDNYISKLCKSMQSKNYEWYESTAPKMVFWLRWAELYDHLKNTAIPRLEQSLREARDSVDGRKTVWLNDLIIWMVNNLHTYLSISMMQNIKCDAQVYQEYIVETNNNLRRKLELQKFDYHESSNNLDVTGSITHMLHDFGWPMKLFFTEVEGYEIYDFIELSQVNETKLIEFVNQHFLARNHPVFWLEFEVYKSNGLKYIESYMQLLRDEPYLPKTIIKGFVHNVCFWQFWEFMKSIWFDANLVFDKYNWLFQTLASENL